MIIVDSHVHIHDCFDLGEFLSNSYLNMKSEADRHVKEGDFTGVLMLAESSGSNWFHRLWNDTDNEKNRHFSWSFEKMEEPCSIYAEYEDEQNLILVAGRQVVTKEGLEVLVSGTAKSYPDGIPILTLIHEALKEGLLPIIPWGAGKWTGKRRKILLDLMKSPEDTPFCLGDNSGRPGFWKESKIFEKARILGIPLLRGSDPLPFKSGQSKSGAFGFMLDAVMEDGRPFKLLKNQIAGGGDCLVPYGRLESVHRFCINFLRMQMKKRGFI